MVGPSDSASTAASAHDLLRRSRDRGFQERPEWHWLVVFAVLIVIPVAFLAYGKSFRGTLNPFAPARQVLFDGRAYKLGSEIPASEVAKMVRIGTAPPTEGGVFAQSANTGMGSAHAVIVVEGPDHRFRLYSLEGGP